MCRHCLAHYLAEMILRRKRSPHAVNEYLAREQGDYQAEIVMAEINRLISRVHRRATSPVMSLGKKRVCDCK